jgi:hypothetical protein
VDDEDDVNYLLDQARRYRTLGEAIRDRSTRLALLEIAVEYEELARKLMGDGGSSSVHESRDPPPMVQGG